MDETWLRLDGKASTFLVEQADDGFPILTYWGRKLEGSGAYLGWFETTPVPTFSLDQNQPCRTFPIFGRGWYGSSALSIDAGGSSWAPEGTLCKVDVSENRIVSTLTVDRRGLQVQQVIALDAQSDVLTLRTVLRNTGDQPLRVSALAAGCLPLPPQARTVESFSGRHNHEFQPIADTLSRSGWHRENRRGLTSHDCPPLALVLGEGATQHSGSVWGGQLAWSGNHRQSIDWLEDGRWLWMAGAWLAPGEITLAPAETLETPDWLATYSQLGRDGVAQNFHAFLRQKSPLRQGKPMAPRPVHINTWEGFYFDHVEADLMALADSAVELGVERFVLDDGWFKGRGDDTAALGDWVHDIAKYPNGLKPLADHVVDCGMQFGLWVEPEMINPDSDLFRAHPDWILSLDGAMPLTARNQLALDMSKSEVQDYLFARLDALLRELPISYLKWDHNRDLTQAGSGDRPAYVKQVHAVYALIDRLRAAHPEVEIESCAGGGGRIDAGILPRTHRVWTSDCIDAVSRIEMHNGFLQFFPPEVMGAHIGASPAHSTGRSQSMNFRAGIALMGHLGLELDTRQLSDKEKAALKSWIALYKRVRSITHDHQVWRGEAGDGVTWTAMGTQEHFILFIVRQVPTAQKFPPRPVLPFVHRDATYALERVDPGRDLRGNLDMVPFANGESRLVSLAGSWLAEVGLPLPYMKAETCLVIEARLSTT